MGVITGKGVVGIVKDVSEHYCSVMSLLHKDFSVSARFRKNAYFGPLTWNGENSLNATLSDIPKHVALVKGDTLETNSSSQLYPEGVLIGSVDEIKLDAGQLARLGDDKLVPGIPVSAYIGTGDRTPMAYLLKPFMDYAKLAFREN